MSEDYEVGYGKPPRHSRFQPKQSGNPGGRPKGARGLKTDLAAELAASHEMKINGQKVRGTRQQLTIRALAIRAASGELKAAQLLLPLVIQVLGIEDRGARKEQLSAQDQALLDELLGRPAGDAEGSAVTSESETSADDVTSSTDEAPEE